MERTNYDDLEAKAAAADVIYAKTHLVTSPFSSVEAEFQHGKYFALNIRQRISRKEMTALKEEKRSMTDAN